LTGGVAVILISQILGNIFAWKIENVLFIAFFVVGMLSGPDL
jgi:hypothetical protein